MRINIIILNHYLPDPRAHKEAKSLAAAGHEVSVYALWKPGLSEQEHVDDYLLNRIRLKTRNLPGKIFAPLLKYIEVCVTFLKIGMTKPAHMYMAHDAKALPPAWLASLFHRAALIYDARELETGRNFGSSTVAKIYQSLWSLPEKLLIRHTDAVITVSDSIADELVRLYRIPRPFVVRNCPERIVFSSEDKLRKELGIPKEMKIVLYQGGVLAGRGIELFLEAIQGLPDVVGIVLGDGPLTPYLHKQIEDGVWERVYLPGKVAMQDLLLYTASADLGIVLIEDTCLSHRYSLPNKLFETIQVGIPVLGSNLPEISAIIHEYGVGTVAKSFSIQDVKNSIQETFSNQHHYQELKRNAEAAAKILNWENESFRLLELVDSFQKKRISDE